MPRAALAAIPEIIILCRPVRAIEWRFTSLKTTSFGLSLRDLAAAIDHLVTAQAIGKYEHNETMPGSGVLIALADARTRPSSTCSGTPTRSSRTWSSGRTHSRRSPGRGHGPHTPRTVSRHRGHPAIVQRPVGRAARCALSASSAWPPTALCSMHRSIAFGDDLPDIGLFDEVGTGVAMEGSPMELAAIAHHVIGSCDGPSIGDFLKAEFLKRSPVTEGASAKRVLTEGD